jgi:hypothetical protein
MLTIMDSAGDVRPLTNLMNTPGNNSQKTDADEQRLFHDRETAAGLPPRAVIFWQVSVSFRARVILEAGSGI